MKELARFIQQFAKEVAEQIKKEVTNSSDASAINEKEWYSVEEVCNKLRITKSTLYRHRNLGYIKPAAYVGRKPLFNKASIVDYLKNFS